MREMEPGLPGRVIAQARRVLGNAFNCYPKHQLRPGDEDPLRMVCPKRNRYDFNDVPPQTYAAFRKAWSKGRFFNAFIRDRYSYHLVEQSPSG
ncbi:KTSC domain-containing protein [Mesorhizobium sp.]|uniref:KTSC domain-containing protein n=1 Tax=Mesorhizobium sp. TaxID=1871066 RepID=UPI00338E4D26